MKHFFFNILLLNSVAVLVDVTVDKLLIQGCFKKVRDNFMKQTFYTPAQGRYVSREGADIAQ